MAWSWLAMVIAGHRPAGARRLADQAAEAVKGLADDAKAAMP